MLAFPNCKINIGLNILSKREDGYHDLETVFYPVPLKDILEIIPVGNQTEINFSSSGIAVNGNTDDNLCIKAYQLLKKDLPQLPAIKMHLHKAIPIGAGLGGGSADAAFTLKLLNDKFKLNLTTEQLISYSLQLGSDCPFFIKNTPCFAQGRGEQLEEIAVNLSGYWLVLINPGIHINTGWAFTEFSKQKKHGSKASLKELISQSIETWKDTITNDFETVVFNHHPAIKEIKEKLYSAGAQYAAMSGSGSTVYGLFKTQPVLPSLPGNYFIHPVLL